MSPEQAVIMALGIIGALLSYIFKSSQADMKEEVTDLKEANKAFTETLSEIGQDMGRWTTYQEKNFLRKEDAKETYIQQKDCNKCGD